MGKTYSVGVFLVRPDGEPPLANRRWQGSNTIANERYASNTRDSGLIKAHIARKGAPTAGGWGIVKLLKVLQFGLNNPTATRIASLTLVAPSFTQGRLDIVRYRGIVLS